MSLAPLSMNASASTLPPPLPSNRTPRQPAESQPATTSVPAKSEVTTADEINRQIEAEKEGMLAYRLIQQLMIERQSSESFSFQYSSDDLAINLSQSRATSESLSIDQTGLQYSWTQTESFAATIVGDGFQISIAGVRIQSMQLQLEAEVGQSDPLQIDMSGDGFETTGLSWSVRFDITGDGQVEDVSVAADDDAVLALDRNRNGRIDNGKELFGEQNGHANGYAQLRRYDDNHDAVIDASDRIFSALQLLRWHSDGRQQLQSLTEAGIVSIGLKERQLNQAETDQGDAVTTGSSVRFHDGNERQMADLWYRFLAAS